MFVNSTKSADEFKYAWFSQKDCIFGELTFSIITIPNKFDDIQLFTKTIVKINYFKDSAQNKIPILGFNFLHVVTIML